jgi:hypothetical protein
MVRTVDTCGRDPGNPWTFAHFWRHSPSNAVEIPLRERLRAGHLKSLLSRISVIAAAAGLLSGASVAPADETLSRVGTIQVPGTSAENPFDMFDVGLVDRESDRYLLSDIANKSVDVFKASTGTFLFRIPGFYGILPPCCERVGPGSMEMVGHDELWVTDGDSTIKIVNLKSKDIVESISTRGRLRTDSLAYDPQDQIMTVNNPDDAVAYLTFISTKPGHRILGKLAFPRATAGLEQSVWVPRTGLYYLTIPELDGNHALGAVAEINARSRAVLTIHRIEKCRPNAVVRGPQDQLLIGCGDAGRGGNSNYGFLPQTFVMNVDTGKVTAIAKVNGSDQAWYNPSERRYYLAALGNPGGPILATIDASGRHAVLTAPSQHFAHSVTVDPVTNRAFVPFSSTPEEADCLHGCIALYAVLATTKVEQR